MYLPVVRWCLPFLPDHIVEVYVNGIPLLSPTSGAASDYCGGIFQVVAIDFVPIYTPIAHPDHDAIVHMWIAVVPLSGKLTDDKQFLKFPRDGV
jgi:hypothetical protein